MAEGSNSNCKSKSHKLLKDKAKKRVDDLQVVFSDLQYARKESRIGDVAVLEEKVNQMLRELKDELHGPSPASSLQGGSLGSFGMDISVSRLLQICEEEEDDATSKWISSNPELSAQNPLIGEILNHQEMSQINGYQFDDECKFSVSNALDMAFDNWEETTLLDPFTLHSQQDFEQNYFSGSHGLGVYGSEEATPNIADFHSHMPPPPSAFLGPTCALWDCPRPAQGSDRSQGYCSSFHADLASKEGPPGMSPVLRPGGIGLKDGLIFAALYAKTQGKEVGIPECEGAATAKCPWNAPELFDILVLDGETIREWLFFDKPRRAFGSGNRKQRLLPDYSGRGWHESRNQVMSEYEGRKRSYYMDPQPLTNYEWHLYEYEINNYDACALYRLEFKLAVEKKSPKTKLTKDPVTNLEKQMGRLTAEVASDNKPFVKGRARVNAKDGIKNVHSPTDKNKSGPVLKTSTSVGSVENQSCSVDQMKPANDKLDNSTGLPNSYYVENFSDILTTAYLDK